MNDHFLAVTGKAYIAQGLEPDTEYSFTGVITTYGTDKRSNQEGSYSYTHKARFSDAVVLIKGDTVILGKDRQKRSQKLRQAIFALGHDYDKFMPFIMSKLDDLTTEYEEHNR